MPASPDEVRRILIVDDHPIMRQGIALLINNEGDLSVCGEAESAEQCTSMAVDLKPDLVLADISLPGRNGLELVKDLQAMEPDLPVLILSMHDESLYAERVLRAGGRGYVMKQAGGEKLVEAIRRVLEGQVYVSPKMSEKILEMFSNKRSRKSSSPIESLTDREFEVFDMVGRGLGTREIAEKLNLSVKTVEVHRSRIKEKLKVESGPALVRYAVRWVESQDV